MDLPSFSISTSAKEGRRDVDLDKSIIKFYSSIFCIQTRDLYYNLYAYAYDLPREEEKEEEEKGAHLFRNSTKALVHGAKAQNETVSLE